MKENKTKKKIDNKEILKRGAITIACIYGTVKIGTSILLFNELGFQIDLIKDVTCIRAVPTYSVNMRGKNINISKKSNFTFLDPMGAYDLSIDEEEHEDNNYELTGFYSFKSNVGSIEDGVKRIIKSKNDVDYVSRIHTIYDITGSSTYAAYKEK